MAIIFTLGLQRITVRRRKMPSQHNRAVYSSIATFIVDSRLWYLNSLYWIGWTGLLKWNSGTLKIAYLSNYGTFFVSNLTISVYCIQTNLCGCVCCVCGSVSYTLFSAIMLVIWPAPRVCTSVLSFVTNIHCYCSLYCFCSNY